MKTTEILPIEDPLAIQRAAALIQSGAVIAFPTDTVYGIGVSAFQELAIEKIYQTKGRSHLKAIPILLADPSVLPKITPTLSPAVESLIRKFWPGPLTIVLPQLASLPANLSPGTTIGVRIPDHDLTRKLLRKTGPLAATSANLSGTPSALSADEVLDQLDGKVDLIFDGGKSPGGTASTVLDCTGDLPALLREGPVSWEDIQLELNLG